jgi:hypothetical protein
VALRRGALGTRGATSTMPRRDLVVGSIRSWSALRRGCRKGCLDDRFISAFRETPLAAPRLQIKGLSWCRACSRTQVVSRVSLESGPDHGSADTPWTESDSFRLISASRLRSADELRVWCARTATEMCRSGAVSPLNSPRDCLIGDRLSHRDG